MTYEEAIQNESQFRQGARGKKNFSQLYQDQSWKAGASNWGTSELFAARAICLPERALMTPLSEFYSDEFDYDNANPNIAPFHVGIENMDNLAWQSERELVHATGSGSLGGIWAALGALLRREQFAPTQAVVEDSTIRLASSIVRHILNYQQDTTKARLLSWRDQRVTYGYRGGSRAVSARDDGGVEMWLPGSGDLRQFALLEAKLRLTNVDGKPHVSDQVLAQMAGQAIALQRSELNHIAACQNMYVQSYISPSKYVLGTDISVSRSVTILATTHFIRFYVFQFSDTYFQNNMYESLASGANGCHMRIYPTKWLDVKRKDHREEIILHVCAILGWASSLP